MLKLLGAGLLSFAGAGGAVAQSSLPAMSFLTAPLVSPTSAQSFYGTATTHTNSFTGSSNPNAFSGQPPEIVETARALKNNPDLIYEYVHNLVQTEFAFGERKGPLGALIDKSGTPFDQNVLFVNLVRQAGYTAQYVIAPVTITSANFQTWTGISDIQAACRLLSSGGIPAAFNGATSSPTDCSTIGTGAFTSVTILHVYSQVNIGGTLYAYDPSFKSYTVSPGLNLISASGLVSGQAAAAAASTISSGSSSGVNYIKNASTENLDAYISARGQALLSYIKTNAPATDMDGVVGVTKIIPTYMPTGGWRNTTPTGYTVGTGVTVTGDMPDQYRTKFAVALTSAYTTNSPGQYLPLFNWSFFVDDIDGRRLGIGTNFNRDELGTSSNVTYTAQTVRLLVDDVPIQSFSCTYNLTTCLQDAPTQMTLSITHPYAANSGTYGNQTVTRGASWLAPTAIIAGFGFISPARLTKWSNELASDQSLPLRQGAPFPCQDLEDTCWATYDGPTGNFNQQKLAASWLGQLSRLAQVQAAMTGAVADQQHSIGTVGWNYTPTGYYYPQPVTGQPLPPHYTGITDQETILNIDTSMTLTSKTNSMTSTNATSRAIALAAATLEGGVLEQMEDLPDTASTASRFAWGNRPEVGVLPTNDNEDPCFSTSNPRQFFDFTGSGSSTRMGLYQYEGSATGCGAAPSINDQSQATTAGIFINGMESVVSQYETAGFKVTASAETFLGPGARFGPAETGKDCDAVNGCKNIPPWNEQTLQRGGAVIATQFDTTGRVSAVANVLASTGGILKGGGGKQPENSGQYDPSKAGDILKDRFVDRSVLLGVDLKTGTAGYSTPSLLSVGNGDSPYKLDFDMTFKAAPSGAPEVGQGPFVGPYEGGWNSSWSVFFTNSGSGQEALGATSPMAAAGTLAAFLVMQDLFTETDRTNMEQDVYAALTADWWRQQTVANVATVSEGFSGKQYVRLVDGSWMAPIGSPSVLTQTGSRVKTRDQCYGNVPSNANPDSTSRRWDHSQVSFSLREADGEVMAFTPWSDNYDVNAQCAIVYGYQPSTWTFPQGPTLTFTTNSFGQVTAVNSSLGRSFSFTNPNPAQSVGPIATANGLTVGMTNITGPNATPVVDAAGDTWNFSYVATSARSTTSYNRPIPYLELSQVFEPVSSTQAALAYTYDTRGIVETAKDATAIQQGTRGPYSWYIAEGGRGERDDPNNFAYTVYYDTDSDAVRYIDELGRETDATWDGRHRVLTRTFPAQDQEQFAYDTLDNVVQLTQVPKIVGELPNIVISATYDPTWNKLASITDANGNTSNFTYYAAGTTGASMMQQAQRPAVNGTRPTYTFQYNSAGLPTQAVDGSGVTTNHGYDSYGNLTSTTTGAAAANGQPALNLTTTFTPDVVGNVVTAVDPRGNATTTQYDAMRRKLAEQRLNGGAGTLPLAAEQYTYDANGRKLTDQKATGFNGSGTATGWEVTTTSYTPTGKVASVTDPLSEQTTTTYDGLDRVYQVTDPVSRVTQYVYDAAGQKTGELRAVGTSLQQTYAGYSYNLDGFQNGVTDANGNYTTQGRDGFNRPQVTYYPSTTKGSGTSDGTNYEQLGYDANGNKTSLRKRNGNTISYQYDALNRETVKTVPANGSVPGYSVYTSYDLADRPLSVGFTSTSGPGVVYTYDAAGRQLTETTNGETLTSAYDAANNRTGLTWPDGNAATYVFDPLDRMTSAVLGGVTTTIGYDNLSRRTSMNRSTGAATGYGYDAADRLTWLSHSLTTTSANVAFTYGYTAASQVSSRSTSNTSYLWAPPTTPTTNYNADGLNRDATLAANSGYDANGNLINDGTRTFAYDEENHLVSVASGGTALLALAYDPTGRLQQTTASGTATNFLYDGNDLVAEFNSSNAILRRYLPGSGEDEPLIWFEGAALSAPRSLHADAQGSIIGWSDGAGNSGGTFLYGPYGERSSWSGPRYAYTGQIELPEASLYYYKARIYDPVRGWFLQTDPVGYKDDLNLYVYAFNDPVNNEDPTGEECEASRIGAAQGSICGGSDSIANYLSPPNKKNSGASGAVQGAIAAVGTVINNVNNAVADAEQTVGAATQNLTDKVVGAITDPGFWASLGPFGGEVGATEEGAGDAVAEIDKVASLEKEISQWVGPEAKFIKTSDGNIIVTSKNGLRAFRIDFSQRRGVFQGPHAVFETRVSTNRPFQPVSGTSAHIYFGGH